MKDENFTKDSVVWTCSSLILGSVTNQPVIISESNKGGSSSVALVIVNDLYSTMLLLPNCNTRVGGAKVYSYATSLTICAHSFNLTKQSGQKNNSMRVNDRMV